MCCKDESSYDRLIQNPSMLANGFLKVQPMTDRVSSYSRVVWLEITGLPFECCSMENISLVAKQRGEVLYVPEESRNLNQANSLFCLTEVVNPRRIQEHGFANISKDESFMIWVNEIVEVSKLESEFAKLEREFSPQHINVQGTSFVDVSNNQNNVPISTTLEQQQPVTSIPKYASLSDPCSLNNPCPFFSPAFGQQTEQRRFQSLNSNEMNVAGGNTGFETFQEQDHPIILFKDHSQEELLSKNPPLDAIIHCEFKTQLKSCVNDGATINTQSNIYFQVFERVKEALTNQVEGSNKCKSKEILIENSNVQPLIIDLPKVTDGEEVSEDQARDKDSVLEDQCRDKDCRSSYAIFRKNIQNHNDKKSKIKAKTCISCQNIPPKSLKKKKSKQKCANIGDSQGELDQHESLDDLLEDKVYKTQSFVKPSKALGKLINMKRKEDEMRDFDSFIQGMIVSDNSSSKRKQ